MDEDINVGSQTDLTEETTSAASEAESKSTQSVDTATEKSGKLVDSNEEVVETTKTPKTVPYDRLAEVVKERNELREKALLFDRLQQDPTLAQAVLRNVQFQQPDPITQQAEAKLREMGVPFKGDVEQMISQEIERREFIRDFGSKMEALAQKYDGSDGLPKFDPEDIATFIDEQKAKGVNLFDPEMAYRVKYLDAIADAKAKAKRGTAYSEKPGKPMQSADLDGTDKLIREAKETGDWTKVFLHKVS